MSETDWSENMYSDALEESNQSLREDIIALRADLARVTQERDHLLGLLDKWMDYNDGLLEKLGAGIDVTTASETRKALKGD